MRTTFRFGSIAIFALLVAACGGSTDDSGIASLSDDDSDSAAGGGDSDTTTEEDLLAYVECLRGQGIDVPDPEVDADGNLQLAPPGGAGGPGGQTEGDDESGAAGPEFDRDAFQQAREACGEPPGGAIGGFADVDQSEFQDAALAMAQCLRDKGYDVDDPDLSNFGPGANDDAETDDDDDAGGGPPQGGFFGDLDLDDADVQADVEECRDSAFAGLDLPQGGPGGGGPGGGGPGGGGGN